jgi:hypothetical protein
VPGENRGPALGLEIFGGLFLHSKGRCLRRPGMAERKTKAMGPRPLELPNLGRFPGHANTASIQENDRLLKRGAKRGAFYRLASDGLPSATGTRWSLRATRPSDSSLTARRIGSSTIATVVPTPTQLNTSMTSAERIRIHP